MRFFTTQLRRTSGSSHDQSLLPRAINCAGRDVRDLEPRKCPGYIWTCPQRKECERLRVSLQHPLINRHQCVELKIAVYDLLWGQTKSWLFWLLWFIATVIRVTLSLSLWVSTTCAPPLKVPSLRDAFRMASKMWSFLCRTLPSGVKIAMGNGHRNSGFPH